MCTPTPTHHTPATPKHAGNPGNPDRQCVELVDVRARLTCRECSLRLLWYWGYSFNRRLMSFTSWWGEEEGRVKDGGRTGEGEGEQGTGRGVKQEKGRGRVNRRQGGGGDSLRLFWQTHTHCCFCGASAHCNFHHLSLLQEFIKISLNPPADVKTACTVYNRYIPLPWKPQCTSYTCHSSAVECIQITSH